jgi:hypothetical protein
MGDYFVIVEPDQPLHYLQDTPIFETIKPIVPIERPLRTADVLPLNPNAGEQRYFLFHGCKIATLKPSIVSVPCSGTFCDRQVNITNRNIFCGCMHKNSASGIVLRMNIKFDFVLDRQEMSYTVTNFQSWRTTTLFHMPITQTTDMHLYTTDTDAIRPTVANITSEINENKDWTICGWLRRGEVVDASAT